MQNKQLTMEPDRARDTILNLVRRRRKFACEQTTTVAHLRDVVCVAIDGEFVKTSDSDFVDAHAQHIDEASQLAVNCLNSQVNFAVVPMDYPDGRAEWLFTFARRKR